MADAQPASLAERNGLDPLDRLVGALEHTTRLGEEGFARFREAHAVGAAVEEADAELSLQVANLPAQWWLRNVETRRRSRDVLFFSDGDEITKVPKLHVRRTYLLGMLGARTKSTPGRRGPR